MSDFETALERFIQEGDFLRFTTRFDTSIARPVQFPLHQSTAQLLDTGVLLVEPLREAASDIIVSAGIHGNETAPIEIVNQLITGIISRDIQVRNRMLFIIGNPTAMNAGKRFIDENLNRLFCGKYRSALNTSEGKRAQKIEQYIRQFFDYGKRPRYHYDLHTAIRASKFEKFAVYPFRKNHDWRKPQLEFLHAAGINTILLSHAPTSTLSFFSSDSFGADAFTLELGKAKPFGENDISQFTSTITCFKSLIENKEIETTQFRNEDFNLYKVLDQIVKKSENFKLHVSGKEQNFTDFPVGTLLAEDVDESYVTRYPGEAIVFPNPDVKIGQRAALMVIPTEL